MDAFGGWPSGESRLQQCAASPDSGPKVCLLPEADLDRIDKVQQTDLVRIANVDDAER